MIISVPADVTARIQTTMREGRFKTAKLLAQAAFALYEIVIHECEWKGAKLILRYPNGDEKEIQHRPE